MKLVKQLIVVLTLSMIPSAALACDLSEKIDGYENTDIQHTLEHWKAGDKSPVPFMLLDVRTAEEYAEGHIKGALLIPVQELQQRISEVPQDKQVYIYCRSGVRSVRASKILVNAGYTRIENVQGGFMAWKDAGYPVEIGR
jgi:hydroxyacylglutathione hydrolase